MLTHNENVIEDREPRRGIAPFATGIEVTEDRYFEIVESKEFQFGSLGKAIFTLQRVRKKDLEKEVKKEDQAFTIDLSGKIHRGNLRDFYRNGYYQVMITITPPDDIKPIGDERLTIHLWIDNTEPIVSTHLSYEEDINDKAIDEGSYQAFFNKPEKFVLPYDPKILEAVRINVATNGADKN